MHGIATSTPDPESKATILSWTVSAVKAQSWSKASVQFCPETTMHIKEENLVIVNSDRMKYG